MMEKHDFYSSLTLLAVGGIIFAGSLDYPFGEINNPGPGFVPGIAATILIIISLVILIGSFQRENVEKKKKFFFEKENAKRVVLGAIFLVAYRVLFPVIGFMPVNFLFFLLILRILGGFRWKASLRFSFSITIGAYLLFQKLLEVQLPIGIFKI